MKKIAVSQNMELRIYSPEHEIDICDKGKGVKNSPYYETLKNMEVGHMYVDEIGVQIACFMKS